MLRPLAVASTPASLVGTILGAMVDTLKHNRENIARLALLLGAGYVLVSLVRVGYQLAHHVSLVEVARSEGGASLSIVMVLVVVATVLACVLLKPVTAGARSLVRSGALLVGLGALLEAIFTVIGLFRPAGGILGGALEVVGAVFEIGLKAAVALVLWRVARAGVDDEQPELSVVPTPVDASSDDAQELQQASWSPDQAVGAVWSRAGDAATGAKASGFGSKQATGWQVPATSDPEPALPPAPRGNWATAGELAQGKTEIPAVEENQPTGERPAVSWNPPPRSN